MSTYIASPGVPRVKIGVYPKRHSWGSFPREESKATRADVAAESLSGLAKFGPDVCYSDFFVDVAGSVPAQVA